jgi:hypothetical protein
VQSQFCYRLCWCFWGKQGEQIIILLGGGTKQRQQSDFKLALERAMGRLQAEEETAQREERGEMIMALTLDS